MEEEEVQQPESPAEEAPDAPVNIRQEIQAWFAEHFQGQSNMSTEVYNKYHAAKEELLVRLKV